MMRARISLIGSVAMCLSQAAAAATISIPFSPSNFSHPLRMDNRYFKLIPGDKQFLRSRAPGQGCESVRITVTDDTKQIDGIATRIVHDVVFSDDQCNGSLTKIEDTLDYYAQDDAGNVWYMGEISHDCDGAKCTLNEGSWIGGQDIFGVGTNAKPGFQMLAHPHVGDHYRQEYYPGHAEDEATVVAKDVTVKLTRTNAYPPKAFTDCIKIKEFTALEPTVTEFKNYCPGVGFVLGTEQPGDIRTERIKEPEDDALKFRSAP